MRGTVFNIKSSNQQLFLLYSKNISSFSKSCKIGAYTSLKTKVRKIRKKLVTNTWYCKEMKKNKI